MVRRICDDNRLTWDRESESQCDTAGSGQVDRGLQFLRMSLHTPLDSPAELLCLDWLHASYCLCLMVLAQRLPRDCASPICASMALSVDFDTACWYYIITGPWRRMQTHAQGLLQIR